MIPSAHSLSRPSERPETASTIMARSKPAFRLRFDPRQIDRYDLSKAPADALKKAGLEAGIYWLPRPYEMPAQPGVNGVWCDVDAGWKTEDVLAKGYPELTAEERAAGVVLLDAWEEIPREFCPKGVDAGPVLRFVATRNGRYYHSVWGGLDVTDPREDAREIHDSALQACWIAWKIQQGALPAASQAQADQAIARGQQRGEQLLQTPSVTEASAALVRARAALKMLESAIRVVRGD